MIDLEKLDKEITDIFERETKDDFIDWLNQERTVSNRELIQMNERYDNGIFTEREKEARKRFFKNSKYVIEMVESKNNGINPILGYKTE